MAGIGCKDCVSGALHSGNPSGNIENLHGLQTYVATPPKGFSPKGVVVMIPDAFGWELANTRILADNFARRGQFLVYLPDFMNGHYLSEKMLSAFQVFELEGNWGAKIVAGCKASVYFTPFLLNNRLAVTQPRILSFLDAVRINADTSKLPLGVAGFCWGGKFAALLCNANLDGRPNNRIDVAFAAHPSQLEISHDVNDTTKPISIAVGDNDSQLGAAGLKNLQAALEGRARLHNLKHEIVVYPGAKHGFAIRGDPSDEVQKRQGLEAEDQAIVWFSQCFSDVK